jgi:hypothetical protein
MDHNTKRVLMSAAGLLLSAGNALAVEATNASSTDIVPDADGKVIIDLTPLDLQFYDTNNKMPTEWEMPAQTLAARRERRRVSALERNSISVRQDIEIPDLWKFYFYLEGGELRIFNRNNQKEVTVDKIEIKYGRKAVNVDGLELGHTYLKLPVEVAEPFERILKENELKKRCLVLRGKSVLDGKKYYGFNMEIPAEKWERVSDSFLDFGTDDKELNGFLTCQPGRVAEILGVPIEAGI